MDPIAAKWVNAIAAGLGALGTATALFTPLFGDGTANMIVAGIALGALFFGAVNAALHAGTATLVAKMKGAMQARGMRFDG
jgi:hypothetical protein